MADKELKAIQSRISDYNKNLEEEPSTIDVLKQILNVITTIKDKSMEMEFRINDVQEQFRILKIYDFKDDVSEETHEVVKRLD